MNCVSVTHAYYVVFSNLGRPTNSTILAQPFNSQTQEQPTVAILETKDFPPICSFIIDMKENTVILGYNSFLLSFTFPSSHLISFSSRLPLSLFLHYLLSNCFTSDVKHQGILYVTVLKYLRFGELVDYVTKLAHFKALFGVE
jgi:hypothetical protein